VIVFRGTDKSFGDLFTDFRWVTRFIPFTWDQYDQTRALIPDLVKYIRSKYGDDVRIITTGHSLGGGLAQQALYVTPYIKMLMYSILHLSQVFIVSRIFLNEISIKLVYLFLKFTSVVKFFSI